DISIKPPPPPKPKPGQRYSTKGSLAGLSYKNFCKAASASTSLTSSDVKALMTAANKERKRLGFRSLSWSSSLANASTNYSQDMVAASNSHPELAPGSNGWFNVVFKHDSH